jgi:hypothetical protein
VLLVVLLLKKKLRCCLFISQQYDWKLQCCLFHSSVAGESSVIGLLLPVWAVPWVFVAAACFFVLPVVAWQRP